MSKTLPTMRQGVQSSNCALSCLGGPCKLGVVISCAISMTRPLESVKPLACCPECSVGWLLQFKSSDEMRRRAAGAGNPCRRASSHSLYSRELPAKCCPTTLQPHDLARAWIRGDLQGKMSTIETLYIFDEHK
jgi:hypothetical protein